MFREGYLEVLGLTDPNRYSSVKDMVARYEGLHIVALGCADADSTYRALSDAGVPVEAPRALERDAAYGPADNEIRRARFRNIYLDRARYPEARFLYIEHLTRDVLWQPHLLDHPNGALALEEVYFCAEELETSASRISAAVGLIRHLRPAHVELRLTRGRLLVLDRTTWGTQHFAVQANAPMPVGFGVRVRSLEATRALLAERSVQTVAQDGIWVAPESACGAAIRFFEESTE